MHDCSKERTPLREDPSQREAFEGGQRFYDEQFHVASCHLSSRRETTSKCLFGVYAFLWRSPTMLKSTDGILEQVYYHPTLFTARSSFNKSAFFLGTFLLSAPTAKKEEKTWTTG